MMTAMKEEMERGVCGYLSVLREFHYAAALNASKALTQYSITLWTENSAFNRTLFGHRADFGWLSLARHGLRLSSFRRLPSLRVSMGTTGTCRPTRLGQWLRTPTVLCGLAIKSTLHCFPVPRQIENRWAIQQVREDHEWPAILPLPYIDSRPVSGHQQQAPTFPASWRMQRRLMRFASCQDAADSCDTSPGQRKLSPNTLRNAHGSAAIARSG
jgi:hypothetical protein